MSAYYVQESNFFSKRAIVFAAIIALHILAIYAFASGLATSATKYVQTIIQTTIIEQDKPKVLPPPPPPVKLEERPPVQVVAPEVNISVPTEAPPITNVTTHPVPKPPPPVVHVRPVVRTAPQGRWRDSEDFYPAASQRANEEGRPVVEYCVGANGKLQSVQISQSSGFPRLDNAAIALVKASTPFKPGTADGRPADTCSRLAVKFQIR
jgi:periplasmic protein TonB